MALIAIVGYLVFGWSFDGSGSTVSTVIGVVVALGAVGWTLYSRVYSNS